MTLDQFTQQKLLQRFTELSNLSLNVYTQYAQDK